MKLTKLAIAPLVALLLVGCGSSSSDTRGSEAELPELESAGKTLVFYNASTNEQNAYTVDDGSVLNLQGATDKDDNNITNFNMASNKKGKFFVWLDNKGDTNASNDEDKIIMFNPNC